MMAYSLKKGEVIPDRDLALIWVPEQHQRRPTLQVFTDGKKDPCFLALVTPPLKASLKRPREVTVLVDHSGSMEGAKWEAAEWAVEKMLRSLRPEDRFNLCLFHSVTRWFAPAPVEASKANVDSAVMFLRSRDSGGTELGIAMEQAFMQKSTPGDLTRQVFIVTDAQVTDEERILGLVHQEAAKRARRRCSVLCIDASPNSRLVRRIAKDGGGSCRFLTSSPEEEDITTAMYDILREWNSPEAEGLTLFSSRTVTMFSEGSRADSYYLDGVRHGRSYWLVGRCIDGEGPLRFLIEKTGVDVGGKPVKGVDALYGALLMDELEMLRGIGTSREHALQWMYDHSIPAEELSHGSAYAENEQAKVERYLARVIESTSLMYGVIGSETAFVATCIEKDQKVKSTVMVGSALPAGWSGAFQSPLPSPSVSSSLIDHACYSPRSPSIMMNRSEILDSVMDAFNYGSCPEAKPKKNESKMVCGHHDGAQVGDAGEVTLVEVAAGEKVSDLDGVVIPRLEVLVPCSTEYDGDAEVQIFIGDMARPVARALLRDVIAMEGRPLNLVRTIDQPLKVVLYDPSGSVRDLDYKVILVTAPAHV